MADKTDELSVIFNIEKLQMYHALCIKKNESKIGTDRTGNTDSDR